MSGRHYRTRRNLVAIYPFATLVLLLGLLLVFVPRGGLVVHIGAVVYVVLMVCLTRNAVRLGVEVRQDAMVVYGPFGSRRVEWNDVAGLSTHRWSIK